MEQLVALAQNSSGENKGKLVGQKAPLRLKESWAIRIRLINPSCRQQITFR
jgi:hypothetical protein